MRSKLLTLIVGLGFAAHVNAAASTTSPNYKQALAAVNVLEMPAQAANLVSQMPTKDRAGHFCRSAKPLPG